MAIPKAVLAKRLICILLVFIFMITAISCSSENASGSDSQTTEGQTTDTENEPSTEAETDPETANNPDDVQASTKPQTGAIYQNVTYKTVEEKELQLDIYTPTVEVAEKTPVLFYVHGGSWNSGTRSISGNLFTPVFEQVRALGITVVPVTYRLTTAETTFPAHINDVCDAIRFIVKNAEEYNIDTDRIGLIGFSAGGHLSLLAGLCTTMFGDDPELADTDFDIKCVLDFCGPCDFTQLTDYDDEISRIYALALLGSFLGKPFEGNEDYYAYASPISYASANDVSIIMIQGLCDELVPYKQVERMYELFSDAGMDVTYVPVENATHAFTAYDTSLPTAPTFSDITGIAFDYISEKLI